MKIFLTSVCYPHIKIKENPTEKRNKLKKSVNFKSVYIVSKNLAQKVIKEMRSMEGLKKWQNKGIIF